MKMIRRVVGISHVEDLDGIDDRAVRAQCESHALALGKRLVFASSSASSSVGGDSELAAADGALPTAEDVCGLARSLSGSGGGAAASNS